MRTPVLASFVVILLIACGGSPPAGTCASSAECEAGEECVDGTCVARMDAGGGQTDAGPGDAGGSCPTAIVCGSPPVCCSAAEECISGACVPACASGVRCGADLSACCASGQVCVSDACTDVGDACSDSYDCPEGDFCEPTLERCLPQFDPVTCRLDPVLGPFSPELEWSVTAPVDEPDHVHAIVMPAVVDLDGDRAPELVASFFAATLSDCSGVLRAMRGTTGEIVWTVRLVDGAQISACPTYAVGDLDGDGAPEIVTMLSDGRAVALRASGELYWTSTRADGTAWSAGDYRQYANSAFAIADLDGDGSPEIAIGAVVFDASGRLLWERDAGTLEGDNGGYVGGLPAIADIDLDGAPEIVTGRRAYERDGTQRWIATSGGVEITDGYPAIGDFDEDAQPEVVLVTQGNVYLIDALDGVVQWGPIAIPGGGRGGPPTVADFDGDGRPEIGVAGGSSYSVYDPDGATPVLWSRPTQDSSSNATGSAVFDFEGDGAAEVIYADECYLRAYRGSDGEVLLEVENSSGTQHEYPVVADIDGDGNSEIAIVANDNNAAVATRCRAAYPGWAGERHGVFVYGDPADRWVRTRRIWNQHTYHVTNVEPDGSIPALEADNWTTPGLDNYRQNTQGAGVFNAPDLTVVALDVSLRSCPTAVVLRARIRNDGTLGGPAGVPVTFGRGTPDASVGIVGVASTDVPLLPGGTTVVEQEAAIEGEPPFSFYAIVDDDGTGAGLVLECDEDDNDDAIISGVDCDILF